MNGRAAVALLLLVLAGAHGRSVPVSSHRRGRVPLQDDQPFTTPGTLAVLAPESNTAPAAGTQGGLPSQTPSTPPTFQATTQTSANAALAAQRANASQEPAPRAVALDSNGASTTTTAVIDSPVPCFLALPLGAKSANVHLDARSSVAVAGRTITNYSWRMLRLPYTAAGAPSGETLAQGAQADVVLAEGRYLVELTVIDSANAKAVSEIKLRVGGSLETAACILSPMPQPSCPTEAQHGTSGSAKAQVAFDGRGSRSTPGTRLGRHRWSVTRAKDGKQVAAAFGRVVSVALEPGAYNLRLKVVDSEGGSSIEEQSLCVRALAASVKATEASSTAPADSSTAPSLALSATAQQPQQQQQQPPLTAQGQAQALQTNASQELPQPVPAADARSVQLVGSPRPPPSAQVPPAGRR